MSAPVAIVGISAELPSGSYSETNLDHDAFYEFLMSRGESYERLPSDRFNIDSWKGEGLAEIHVDQGSFLKDIDMFDNVEFGISARDAKYMAPVARKLLENCFLALLDSGIDYRTKNIGCFTSGNAWELTNVSEPDEYDARGTFSGLPAMVANRISNHLDLLGPSLPTDTACSSTLTALHLGVQAIHSGDCEAAVIGGCQLNTRFIDWFMYSQGGILSKDGKCKPFDASANGFARAEGCASIVIKPLDAALRDHDKIYATVLGTGINSTGAGAPPGAPVAEAQRDAMIQAFKRAGKSPKEVDYIEAHATGTAKGDPTEANWMGENFKRDDELIIGSVKGNIGHTEIAAFLASLSKVVSAFKHGVIPPNVNLNTLNPAIHWDEYKFRVPLEPTKLPARNGKPLVAVACSGIGGSNGHVVVEGPPDLLRLKEQGEQRTSGPVLLMACGLSPRSSTTIADDIKQYILKDGVDIFALSTVLGRRAKQMTWRSFAVVDTAKPGAVNFTTPQHCSRNIAPVVMIFSGQGPQHKDMGRALFDNFPVFRESILEMDEVYKSATGKSLLADYGLFHGEPAPELSDVWPINMILPSIAVFQMALFDLLVSLGMKPDIVMGHSAGETAVLYASGAAPKAMVVELAVLRGRTFTALESLDATMAALSCGPAEASEMISEYYSDGGEGTVEIACYNSPSAVAIAGHNVAIDRVLDLARGKDIFARKIRTRVPIHSSMMDACQDEYCSGLQELWKKYSPSGIPQIPTYSTLTGELFEGPFEWDYFWKNTRGQVRFTQAMEALSHASDSFTFVENAPHPVLAAYISSMSSESSVFATVRRAKPGKPLSEHSDILSLCGNVTGAGHNCIDFTTLNGRACYELDASLPTYPFTKKQFALYPDTAGAAKQLDTRLGPLNHKYLKVNKDTHPTLGQHIIRGEPIMPAAGYIDMALQYGATSLLHMHLRAILSLSSESPVKVNVELDGAHWTVKSLVPASRPRKGVLTPMTETLHAEGYLSFEPSPAPAPLDLAAIRKRCTTIVDADFYPSLSYFSAYGPKLQRATNAYIGAGEALVSVKGLDHALSQEGNYVLHPAILDASFHIMTYRPFHGDFNPNVYYLPDFVEALTLHQGAKPKYFPAHLYAWVKMSEWAPDAMYYDIVLADGSGACICSMHQFKMAKHRINPLPEVSRPLDVVWQSAARAKDDEQSVDDVSTEDVKVQVSRFRKMSLGGEEWQADQDSADDDLSLAVVRSANILREAILTLGPSRQTIRTLISSERDSFLQEFSKLITNFSGIFFETFVPTQRQAQRLSVSSNNGIVRVTEDNLLAASTTAERQLFDFITLFDPALQELPFEALVRRSGELLVTGGMLVLTFVADLQQETKSGDVFQAYVKTLQQENFVVFNAQCIDTATGAYMITAGRRGKVAAGQPIFDASSAAVVRYSAGAEAKLQAKLNELDVSEEKHIWVVAQEGPDAGSATGLLRALRREYRSWTFRLVVIPTSLGAANLVDVLNRLPSHLRDEPEIVLTDSGDIVVPRMLPLPPAPQSLSSSPAVVDGDAKPNQIEIFVTASSHEEPLEAFVGEVLERRRVGFAKGTVVAGLSRRTSTGPLRVDTESIARIPQHLSAHSSVVASSLPGIVTAILAAGVSSFSHPERLRALRVLVTHCNTSIGEDVAFAYSINGVKVELLKAEATMLELACLGRQSFDLVVSGYADKAHHQILPKLLKPGRGKLFLWDGSNSNLLSALEQDPCTFGDAVKGAVSLIEKHVFALGGRRKVVECAKVAKAVTPAGTSSALFDPTKAYVLLGGIGSLGAHVALMMYKEGARHLVLTSRSGEKSLQKDPIAKRMIEYLKSQSDLELRLEATDATSSNAMKSLLDSVAQPIAGCIILTAALADGLFNHLQQGDFTRSSAAKLGVLHLLKDITAVERLDFVIAFSSVSGLFGVEGQSNYDASNTALEEAICSLSNGFSFICPGILDSTMMSAEDGGSFDHLVEWALSAEDMICWLKDAIFRQKHGQQFKRYVPDLDWEALDRTLGMPQLGKHLVPAWTSAAVPSESRADGIADVVQKVLSIPPDDFSPEVPLTTYGLDSLSASRLAFALRSLVEVSQIQLLANMSLLDLQSRVSTESTDSGASKQVAKRDHTEAELMDDMLAKYVADLKPLGSDAVPVVLAPNPVVLVTGTTGALGSHILAHLLDKEETARVYAFNRPSSGRAPLRERQAAAFASQGLPESLLDSPKLVLVEGDLAIANLGVQEALFEEFLDSVSHIIHNAWRVDFGVPLSGFEDLIKGTRHLLDFCTRSRLATQPSVSLISSIGVYQYSDGAPFAPEAPILDSNVAAQTGYLESKWVGERLVQIASERGVVRTNVIRVGLVTGAESGAWDTAHWMPALAKSALYVGCLPEGEDVISWVPVETVAAAIVDMRDTTNETLHLVHPKPVPWNTVMKPIANILNVPLVPYREWFARLQNTVLDTTDQGGSAKIDALKLMDMYRLGLKHLNPRRRTATESMGLLPTVESAKGLRASATLQDENIRRLSAEEAEKWIQYWRGIGYLPAA